MPQRKTLLVLVGPTAVGKTALAVKLAKALQTEIISADSRQFYRETSIGTAKPPAAELAAVTHHFINSASIHSDFSVGDFERQGLQTLNIIFKTHDAAVLAGGSGLYVDAICRGFDDLPKADPQIRNALNFEFAQSGLQKLQEELKQTDPVYYSRVDIQNPKRVIRALEVIRSTGETFSSFLINNQQSRNFSMIKIGLNTSRALLYQQINNRVDQMIANGLVEEARGLYPYRHLNALQTVGYTELFSHFDGDISLPEAIEKIKQNTRRFAKRQLTWFRKDKEITWFEPVDDQKVMDYVQSTLSRAGA